MLRAAIFDVDGVLPASLHERAWREALDGFADPARFTTAVYQAEVAGKPRLDGARAARDQNGRSEKTSGTSTPFSRSPRSAISSARPPCSPTRGQLPLSAHL